MLLFGKKLLSYILAVIKAFLATILIIYSMIYITDSANCNKIEGSDNYECTIAIFEPFYGPLTALTFILMYLGWLIVFIPLAIFFSKRQQQGHYII